MSERSERVGLASASTVTGPRRSRRRERPQPPLRRTRRPRRSRSGARPIRPPPIRPRPDPPPDRSAADRGTRPTRSLRRPDVTSRPRRHPPAAPPGPSRTRRCSAAGPTERRVLRRGGCGSLRGHDRRLTATSAARRSGWTTLRSFVASLNSYPSSVQAPPPQHKLPCCSGSRSPPAVASLLVDKRCAPSSLRAGLAHTFITGADVGRPRRRSEDRACAALKNALDRRYRPSERHRHRHGSPTRLCRLLRSRSTAEIAVTDAAHHRRHARAARHLQRRPVLRRLGERAARDPRLQAQRVGARQRHRLCAAVGLPRDHPREDRRVPAQVEGQAEGVVASRRRPSSRSVRKTSSWLPASGPGICERSTVPPAASSASGHASAAPAPGAPSAPTLRQRHDRPGRQLQARTRRHQRRAEHEVVAPHDLPRLGRRVGRALLDDQRLAVQPQHALQRERHQPAVDAAAQAATCRSGRPAARRSTARSPPRRGTAARTPRYSHGSLQLGKSSCQPPS